MKALSLWQPWASALMNGTKRFETRGSVRSIPLSLLGKDLAIHAAKRPPRLAEIGGDFDEVCEEITGYEWSDLPLGCVLGVCRPTEVHRTEGLVDRDGLVTPYGAEVGVTELETMLGNYAPGRIATRMETVLRFPEPIPAKGMQGIWEWDHAPHVTILPQPEYRYATNLFDSAEYLDAIGAEETPLEWFGKTLGPEDATAVHAFSEFVKRAGPAPIPAKGGAA